MYQRTKRNWMYCIIVLVVVASVAGLSGTAIAGEKEEVAEKPVENKDAGVFTLKNIKFTLYGHLRLDSSYDDSRTNNGNTAMWVERVTTLHRDDEMNMTPRHTRIGLLFDAPETNGVKPTGKVEFDFYNTARPEDNPGLRLRHAFGKIAFKKGWSILFGQTSDVIAPRVAKTLNTCVMWNTGNLGFRRPQIRLSKKIEAGRFSILFEAAACRAYSATDYDGGETDDGEDAAVPDGQVRICLTRPFSSNVKDMKKASRLELGFWGFCGRRECDYSPDDPTTYKIGGYGMDMLFNLKIGFFIEGEAWAGTGLGKNYRGGIAQDITTSLDKTIDSKGYWFQAGRTLAPRIKLHAGFGCDNPDNDDLAADKRSKNQSTFVNVRYSFSKTGWVGVEFQRFNTYYNEAAGEKRYGDNRVQLTFALTF